MPEGGEAVVSGERGFPAGGAGEHTEMLLIEELCASWSVHDSRYEPEKYDCIAVDDEYVQVVAEMLAGVRVYWHGLDRSESGLAYHGITLIPPESIAKVIESVRNAPEMRQMMEMLVVAERERKFVIHFGV